MTNEVKLKALLADKYDVNEDEIDDTTLITEIIGGDKKLGAHLNEKFGKQPSVKEEEAFDTFKDVLTWLDS